MRWISAGCWCWLVTAAPYPAAGQTPATGQTQPVPPEQSAASEGTTVRSVSLEPAPLEHATEKSDDHRDDEDGWDDEGGWGDEDGDQFESLSTSVEELEPPPTDAGNTDGGQLSVGGFLRHRTGLWVERLAELPLAQARSSLDLNLRYKRALSVAGLALQYRLVADVHFEYDLAYQVDRDSYDAATIDAYESQVIGGETFVALSAGPVELTLGRQIVAWGQGDLISVVDIVNPRDLREPGLAELDDIRLAVLATRIGVFFGAHRLELMAIHEANWGLRPAPLSPFSPLRELLTGDPLAGQLLEGRSLAWDDNPEGIGFDRRTQWLARWQYNGPGLDLAVYAARTLDQQGIVELGNLAAAIGSPAAALRVRLEHRPYWMVAHAGAAPIGDFVVKWEAAIDVERPLSARGATPLAVAGIRRTQVNWLLGLSYAGIGDGTVSLEYAQRLLPNHPERDDDSTLSVLFPIEAPTIGLLYRQTFLRERLALTGSVVSFGVSPWLGLVGRAEVSYSLSDGLRAGVGYVTFHPNQRRFGPLFGFGRNDRVMVTGRYDFQLD